MENISDENLRSFVKDSHSWMDVVSKCGLKTLTRSLQNRIKKLDIDCKHFDAYFDGMFTKINKYSQNEIEGIVSKNTQWAKIMAALGYKSCMHVEQIQKKFQKLGIDFSHVDSTIIKNNTRIPLNDILVQDSLYANMGCLQKRLKRELKWEHRCSMCQNTTWNDRPIPIEIDHINGDHRDNRIENIRFLCPNCHAQTDTYKGKNMRICKNKVQENKVQETQEPQIVKKRGRKTQPHKVCVDCGEKCRKTATRCGGCDDKHRVNTRKVERPSYEQLQNDSKEMSIVKVGKKYGVSDNCIRKWLRTYSKTQGCKP